MGDKQDSYIGFSELRKEQDIYDDLVIGNFTDSFQNLSVKEHLFLNYVDEIKNDVDVIYKGDSDVIINPILLLRDIMKLCERLGEYFIGGVVNNQVYPFYGHYRGDDKPHILQKYWVPDSIWPRDKPYPTYVSGGAYIMSKSLAVELIKVKNNVSILPIDDAYVGCLVQATGIKSGQSQMKSKDVFVELEGIVSGLFLGQDTIDKMENDTCLFSTYSVLHKFKKYTYRIRKNKINSIQLDSMF